MKRKGKTQYPVFPPQIERNRKRTRSASGDSNIGAGQRRRTVVCNDREFDALQRAFEQAMQSGDIALMSHYGNKMFAWARHAGDLGKSLAVLASLQVRLMVQGRFEEAEELGDQLVELYRARSHRDAAGYSSVLHNLASASRRTGKLEKAEALWREALDIDANTHPNDRIGYAEHLSGFGSFLMDLGRYEEAETVLRDALAFCERTCGTSHPNYAANLNNLSQVRMRQGFHTEAEHLLNKALALEKRMGRLDTPGHSCRLNNLAVLRQWDGRQKDAADLFFEALQMSSVKLGPKHRDAQRIRENLVNHLNRLSI